MFETAIFKWMSKPSIQCTKVGGLKFDWSTYVRWKVGCGEIKRFGQVFFGHVL